MIRVPEWRYDMKKATTNGTDAEVIDALTLAELGRFCHAETEWIVELVDHGVLEPVGLVHAEWRFTGANILRARKARRLTDDLGLNLAGIALVLDLLEERDLLLHRLAMVQEG